MNYAFVPQITGKSVLEVFESRLLRRTFGPKREEVRGGWRDLQS
jgi:hypothetical protein